jgi:hypothetical protein
VNSTSPWLRQTPGKRAPIENVADDDLAATGQSLLGSSADERPYAVTPAQQSKDQTATDVCKLLADVPRILRNRKPDTLVKLVSGPCRT